MIAFRSSQSRFSSSHLYMLLFFCLCLLCERVEAHCELFGCFFIILITGSSSSHRSPKVCSVCTNTFVLMCGGVGRREREDENSHAVKLRLALQCLFRRSADTNIWKCDYKLVVYYTYSYYIPTPNVVLLLLLSSSFVRTQG